MPGNDNNPSLQDAGTSAGAEGNNLPPAQGVQQHGEGVPDPTLQGVANLQTVYNINGGSTPAGERGDARNGAESDRKVQNGGNRRSSVQNPQYPFAPISNRRMSGNKDKHLLKYLL